MSFPFIGSGEAAYFEWGEMFVVFDRAPTKAEAKAIAKRVPAPLRDTIEWKGQLLWVASEQGVNRLVKAAYGSTAKAPSKLTTQTRHAMAPATATARFNADIVEWLELAHEKTPILVAFRREDAEAGGTKLDDVHRRSLKELPKVLARIAELGAEENQLGKRLLDAAEHYGVSVPAKTAKKIRAAEAPASENETDWDAMAAQARASLGAPAAKLTKVRREDDLAPALAVLAKHLPKAAARLARMAKKNGLTVRAGATAQAIDAAEARLGAKLTKEHRALLGAFDGGDVGDIVFLGTATKGAKDADLVAFSRIWSGNDQDYTIVARTTRELVLALPRSGKGSIHVMDGVPGHGGGSITRECKTLDIALDFILKAGRVPSNRA